MKFLYNIKLVVNIKRMPELQYENKIRPRADSSHGSAFKSSIFENKQSYTQRQKEGKQVNFPFLNNAPLNTSHLSNDSDGKTGPGNKDHNPEINKIWNKQMTNSSFFAFQSKNSVSSLFQMARTVQEPMQESLKKQSEKQKNKLSFLQVPRTNPIKYKYGQIIDSKIFASPVHSQQKYGKTPSFLKKDTKSNYDPNQKFNEEQVKKQPADNCLQTNKKPIYGTQSAVKQVETKNIYKNLNNSPLNLGNKLGGISPIKSQSAQKNKSTNQPHESPSNSNLLSPHLVVNRSQRKSSLFVQNQKDFYTPTQKSTTKPRSSNFIQIPDRHNTAKNSSKNQFLLIKQTENSGQQQCLSSRNEEKKSKTVIPSFIKFKQKRNELMNKSGIHDKKSQQNRKNSQSSDFQKKFSLQNFQIKQRLGKGAFGDVFLARQQQTGFFCVLKKLSKKKIRQQNLQQLIVRQIKIQTYLTHKHITNLYGFFDDQEFIYLVMEYLSDGSLAQKYNRKKCQQKKVAFYVKQICEGLKFMHIQNIIHRDIKPENVFIHEDYIKIGDFGCSVCSDSKRNTMVGCLAYISPEQLNNQLYDDKIDVWSVGILCYELLTGRPPFQEDIIRIARHQKDAKLSQLKFPSKLQLSEQAKDFTKRLLQEVPQNRMTISEALKHPYITKNSNGMNLIIFSQTSLRQN